MILTNKANGSAEDKETVEDADIEIFLGLFRCEAAAVTEKIYDRNGDDTVDVENQVGFLLAGKRERKMSVGN